MSIRCIVLDFDGTFTDAEAEGAPFERAYRAMLADLVGAPLDQAWAEAQAAVVREAPELGWIYNEQTVAPADADPYIRAGAAALKIFDRYGRLVAHRGLRAAITRPLYDSAYAQSTIAFRPDARDVLESLLASGIPVFCVTNADTDRVKEKIAHLELTHAEHLTIHGNARKYAVGEPKHPSPLFDAVPPSVQLPHLARPVLPRRGAYFDALADIWRRTGAGPESTFVCGDIYELDLALPAALGCHVSQIARPYLHDYERAALAASGGTVAHSLGEVLSKLMSLRG